MDPIDKNDKQMLRHGICPYLRRDSGGGDAQKTVILFRGNAN